MVNAVVLCAGKSTRMQTNISKVLHHVIDKPIIDYIVTTLKKINVNKIVLIINSDGEELRRLYEKDEKIEFVVQENQLGTANAVHCAKEKLVGLKGETLILMGDCPLIKDKTLANLIYKNQAYDMSFLTYYESKENCYGKIVKNREGKVIKITEHKEASAIEKTIKEINTGIYCLKNEVLWKFASYVDNEKNNYRFTDIVELLVKNNKKVQTILLGSDNEFAGVNTREDLVNVIDIMAKRIINKHLLGGVTIIKSETSLIGEDVVIEKDVIIYPNNIIIGKTLIKTNSEILPGCYINNSRIGEGCVVDNSKIINSQIGDTTMVGPFAYIKSDSLIGKSNKIGAFVEVKSSHLGDHVKAAHLSYLGDSEIESGVNVGCGVVTANYDGKQKHKTLIGKDTFIGSNVNLIAPLTIGKNCVIAAGSTITEHVPDGDMAIARNYQVNKTGYGKKYLDK